MQLGDVPLPEVIGKTRLTGPKGVFADNFLTSELKATYRLRWMIPIYCLLPIFAGFGGFIGIGVFLSNRPYIWPIPLMIASGVAAIVAAYMHAAYKETFNKEVESYCASVAYPKPIPFDAILNAAYDPVAAASSEAFNPYTKSHAYTKPKSQSYKPLAWTAFWLYLIALTMFSLSFATNNDSNLFMGLFGASFIIYPICIILGIMAIVKRKKYRVKPAEKAKFNIFAWLTLLPAVAPLFAIFSLANKKYSSLSRHITLWITATQIAGIILMISVVIYW